MSNPDLQIITNNHYRDLLYWYNLTPKEQKEFDYLDTPERQDEATFGRYKGWVYDLHEFSTTSDIALHLPQWNKWHGYQSDTYFSGILIRYSSDYEQVKFGRYYG